MPQLPAVPAFFDSMHIPDFTDSQLLSTPLGTVIVLDASIVSKPADPAYANLVDNFYHGNPPYPDKIVLGYVPTYSANVPVSVDGFDDNTNVVTCTTYNTLVDLQAAIMTWINRWYQNYPQIDGIFFDMGPEQDVAIVTTNVQDFYHSIYASAAAMTTRSHRVLLNAAAYRGGVYADASDPQTYVESGWILDSTKQACDLAILWESEACVYFYHYPPPPPDGVPNQSNVPTWWPTSASPDALKQRVSHTVFNCPNENDMERVVALSKDRGAGYLYVFDGPRAHYDHLAAPPAYWSAELGYMQSQAINNPPAAPPENSYKFYVRDWTENSANSDTGATPSTNPNFFTTSDVWNQLDTTSPTFTNDQPPLDGQFVTETV